jgi:predicted ATPase
MNSRSIDDCSLIISDFASLIGPNNCGKSTVLRAIEIFLNQEKPELTDWARGHEEKAIIIEGIFGELQDWERNTPGIAGIVRDNQISLRLVATQIPEDEKFDSKIKVNTIYEAYIPKIEIQGWSEKWGDLSDEVKKSAQELDIDGPSWRNQSNKEKVRQSLIDNKPHLVTRGPARWTDENISISAALKQAIPQAVLIPAVKDASDDAKSNSATSFGKLLKRIIVPAIEASSEFLELKTIVEKLGSRLTGTNGTSQLEAVQNLTNTLSKRMSEIVEAKVIFKLEPPDTNKFIGTNTSIKIDSGIETDINLQGHGVQRSLIFALIEVIAHHEAEIASRDGETVNQKATVLLFEEPELYMHPHLMRRLKTALKNIAKSDNWQVIISTHSPFLLDIAEDPSSLIIFRKPNQIGKRFKQIQQDPFEQDNDTRNDKMALRAALDFHPTVAEAFFAERVVLVEGDTEIAVFRHSKKLLEILKISSEKSDNTTLISCGGKWTIPAMARLLREFEIPFRVIHDQDRKSRSDDELKLVTSIDPYSANARIRECVDDLNLRVVDDTFEHLIWPDPDLTPVSKNGKPYMAWLRIKELCDTCDGLEPYTKLQDIVRFVYEW